MSIIFYTLLIAYFVGSISFKGILLWLSPPKLFPNQLNKTFSLITPKAKLIDALSDILKGIIGAHTVYSMTDSELLVSIWGIGLILGNTWPIFSKFKERFNLLGFLGVLFYINTLFTIIYILIGIAIFILLNHPELSLVISSTILPFIIMTFQWLGISPTYIILGIFLAIFIPLKLRNKFPIILEPKKNDLFERFKNKNLST
jgi:glycerol-3-phosphate acyltransferase PlsY